MRFLRFLVKIFAVPVMLILMLLVAVFSFVIAMTGVILWIVSALVFIGGVVLLFTGQTLGGIAFLVISFLVSPYGLPALFALLIGKLNGIRHSLKEFILN